MAFIVICDDGKRRENHEYEYEEDAREAAKIDDHCPWLMCGPHDVREITE